VPALACCRFFRERGISYPPRAITLLAIKDQALLELWAEGGAGPRYIRSHPTLALSGRADPKLREGDRQAPEGLYTILHPIHVRGRRLFRPRPGQEAV
jgi:murein L,D-transpeptidase YafK